MLKVASAVIAVTCIALAASIAHAAKFQAEGGRGARGFETVCPADQYLVGFQARSGAWIDQLKILCARITPDRVTVIDRKTRRAAFGGKGGSPSEIYCGNKELISGIQSALVDHGKYVHSIRFNCTNMDNGATRTEWVGSRLNLDRALPREWQVCPPGEVAIGMHGRYGVHVNAVGLICGPWSVPAAQVSEADPAPTTQDNGTNRPGSDYADFVVAHMPQCYMECGRQPQCRAWAYSNPGVYGPQPHCWLKSAVPPPMNDGNFASGVKIGLVEPGTNRPGADYWDFIVPSVQACQSQCVNQGGKCRAWTYANPGVFGADPHCWLKNSIPGPVADTNFTSGVK